MQSALSGVCGARDGTPHLRPTRQHPHSDVPELDHARESNGSAQRSRKSGRSVGGLGRLPLLRAPLVLALLRSARIPVLALVPGFFFARALEMSAIRQTHLVVASHLALSFCRERFAMPHYYFHLRDGHLHEAEVGETPADADSARAHARKVANETARDGVRRGLGRLRWLLDPAPIGVDFH